MARLPKLLALGGALAGAGAAVTAIVRRRGAGTDDPAPLPAVAAPTPSETPNAPEALPRPGVGRPHDTLVDREEAAAAAEAGMIGGRGTHDAPGDDPAMEAVYQAGGGEAEGFEAAEEALIRNASHDDGRGDPAGDAFPPERESDLATAAYGEADDEQPADAPAPDGHDA